ncbi:MAG TPA: hypothetical protein VG370_15405 [Chloroflexota bacterium]|jgi:hypothetical protein|nr:hypothetical protein [Chloroflexota bacterium]
MQFTRLADGRQGIGRGLSASQYPRVGPGQREHQNADSHNDEKVSIVRRVLLGLEATGVEGDEAAVGAEGYVVAAAAGRLGAVRGDADARDRPSPRR